MTSINSDLKRNNKKERRRKPRPGKDIWLPFNMDRKKDIIKTIKEISGRYSEYEVFADWVKCCALAISNRTAIFWRGAVWEEREQAYVETMRKYGPEEQKRLIEMFGMLAETLEYDMTDVLGQVYMESGMGSKAAGQFFTPYHLSEVCAALVLPEPDERGRITLQEPSCGGGGMIIAAAAALKKRGFQYQRDLKVVAQDLDWKGVYMCYLQLSLLGIRAIVVQGDTLAAPYVPGKTPERNLLITPAERGMLV